MVLLDPRRQVVEPFRRALNAILLRWIGIYVLAASVVVCPALCGFGVPAEDVVHACLPLFLVGFIAVHLVHRQRAARRDGWRRAFEADAASARLVVLVGGATMAGVAAALLAIFCPLGEPMAAFEALGIWFPLLAPLYAGAIWISIDCSVRRLANSADASDRRLRRYWHDVAAAAHPGGGRR